MDRQARQERLRERLHAVTYRDAVAGAAVQLSEMLDASVSPEDALPSAAVEKARAAHREQERYHLIWRRVWGVRLKAEVLDVARRLADHADESATLVWVWWDREKKPLRAVPVAFTVSAREVLTRLPPFIGPRADEVGPGGVGSDLLLVSADCASGVHLDYQHYGDRDEYEMLVWGAFARPVA
jgi:hypothetical protein